MKVLNVEPKGYSRQAYGILGKIGEVVEEECDRDRLLLMIPEFDVLIVRLGHKVDAEVFGAGVKLKVVVTATTGLNHIDLKEASRRGVEVLCLKGERQFLDSLTATAELTWTLLLALMRKVPQANAHVRQGGWNRNLYIGNQLKNKTLGLVGLGRLGSIVAEYGLAFKMKVVATDPFVQEMPAGVDKVTLPELLKTADIVTLHVNYGEETHHLIDSHAFEVMKDGAVLINTSRGELIDEDAMLRSLESGRLSGVGLDVLANEADKHTDWPKSSEVWRRAASGDNILIVPHVGGATYESMEATEIFMAQKLVRYLNANDTAGSV